MKRMFLQGLAREAGATTFIETRTYLGDTCWWFRDTFHEIHTIEVDKFLYAQAVRRFSTRRRIHVHHGDSAQLLRTVLGECGGRVFFWLDGHFSAGITGAGDSHCPLLAELDAIYSWSKDQAVIAIDDARCFGRDPGYPALQTIRDLISQKSEGRGVASVENDMIIIRHLSETNASMETPCAYGE